MPYGKVSFVTKLSPLHPGYVTTVCAEMSDVQRAISDRIWGNIMVKADKVRKNRQCWSDAEIRAEISKIWLSLSPSLSLSFSQRRRRRKDEVEYEQVSN
jgi:hypothetical protein